MFSFSTLLVFVFFVYFCTVASLSPLASTCTSGALESSSVYQSSQMSSQASGYRNDVLVELDEDTSPVKKDEGLLAELVAINSC